MTDDIRTITEFIVKEFIPDVPIEQLEANYDLLDGGVIDSIGLLRTIVWLEETFHVSLEDASPENLRSVEAMHTLVEQADQPVDANQR